MNIMKSTICNFKIQRTQAQTGTISSYLPIYNIVLTLGISVCMQTNLVYMYIDRVNVVSILKHKLYVYYIILQKNKYNQDNQFHNKSS